MLKKFHYIVTVEQGNTTLLVLKLYTQHINRHKTFASKLESQDLKNLPSMNRQTTE